MIGQKYSNELFNRLYVYQYACLNFVAEFDLPITCLLTMLIPFLNVSMPNLAIFAKSALG